MLPFSLFLALKYLKPKRTFLSAVTVLSCICLLNFTSMPVPSSVSTAPANFAGSSLVMFRSMPT